MKNTNFNTAEFIKFLQEYVKEANHFTTYSKNSHVIEFILKDGAYVTIEINEKLSD